MELEGSELGLNGPLSKLLPGKSEENHKNLKISIFWDITPYSSLKIKRRFGGTRCPHLQRSAWFLAWLILRPWKWKRCSSETYVDFQRTTWHYIADDIRCENLKTYTNARITCQGSRRLGLDRNRTPPEQKSKGLTSCNVLGDTVL
jgi:hypothetical protein